MLAAAPGIGKTRWMLRMLLEAATERMPCAIGCYEHTEDELKYRLSKQAEAKMSGAHTNAPSSAQTTLHLIVQEYNTNNNKLDSPGLKGTGSRIWCVVE